MNITGRGGETLAEHWEAGPKTYLGLQMAGFPNLFSVTGPGSPSVLSSMITSIEQHVEFIAGAIGHMIAEGKEVMETTSEDEDEWVAHCNHMSSFDIVKTHDSCNSWCKRRITPVFRSCAIAAAPHSHKKSSSQSLATPFAWHCLISITLNLLQIWARTFLGSLGYSCPTLVASGPIGKGAMRSLRMATRVSSSIAWMNRWRLSEERWRLSER